MSNMSNGVVGCIKELISKRQEMRVQTGRNYFLDIEIKINMFEKDFF